MSSTEAKCKRSVLEVGGDLIDQFAYPGGFLYRPPPGVTNPLFNGQATEGGGHIAISSWQQFPEPLFNGLRLTPYGGAGEYLVLPVPPHRFSVPHLKAARPVSYNDIARKRMSAWLGELTKNHGSGTGYLS